MNVNDLIKLLTQKLAAISDTPRLDSELLIAHVLQKNRTWLFTYPEYELTEIQQQRLQQDLERRLQGEPMAYILGYKEFWGLELKVDPKVLIPRPETEQLVDWILTQFEHSALHVADLGVGSGTIAIALAVERPAWTIDATDYSADALAAAKENAQRYQISNIHFYSGNWFAALPQKKYDLIVSNPPYIAEQDVHLSALSYEPSSALCAGADGLHAIRTIVKPAPDYLVDSGYLVLEHGYDQADAVTELLKQRGFTDIQSHRDLAHQPRFVTARWAIESD